MSAKKIGKTDFVELLAKPTLPAERTIEVITGEILDLKQTAGAAILDIGHRLIEAKEILPHGKWLTWLTEQVEFSERSAQNFMRLAKEYSNPHAVADLGARKALMMLALPANERESFMAEKHKVDGQEKTVIDMTTRQLEQAIRERDEARKVAEQAKADAKIAEESKLKMMEDMKATNQLLESVEASREKEYDRMRALEAELETLKREPVEVAVMEVDKEALDKARAEGAAEMQDKLDKAKAAKAKAEEKRRALEEELAKARERMEALEKAEKRAVMSSDKELAQFEVLFLQGQETANKMRGLLLKARGRDDQNVAQGMAKSLRALAEAIGRCAE